MTQWTLRFTSSASILALVAGLGACSSASNKAEEMDTRLERSQNVDSQTKLGMNSDGDVVVRRKVLLAEELRKLEREVYTVEDELYGNDQYGTSGLQGAYRECLQKKADPRVGGSGKPETFRPDSRVTEDENEVKFAIDEKDQLVGVSEEMLRDRIKRFQGHRKVLRERKEEMTTRVEVCETQYKTALINAGFNPEDSKAQGEWVMGPGGYKVWRAKRKATNNPEDLARRKAARDQTPLPEQPAQEE